MYLEDELTIKNCSKIFHLPEIRIRWFAIRTNASENLLTEATKNVRMLSEHVYGICKKAGGLFVDDQRKIFERTTHAPTVSRPATKRFITSSRRMMGSSKRYLSASFQG
jgi:hypothetical protein